MLQNYNWYYENVQKEYLKEPLGMCVKNQSRAVYSLQTCMSEKQLM